MRRLSSLFAKTAILIILSTSTPTEVAHAESPMAVAQAKQAEPIQPTCEASQDEELSRDYTLCLTGASIAGCPLIVLAVVLPLPSI